MNRPLPLSAVLALSLSVLAVPVARSADSPNGRFSLSGARVHVYNLAGKVDIVAGSGRAVTVESTTGGRDGGRIDVKTMPGNEPALIFAYPDKRVVHRRAGRGGERSQFRTTLDVGADGRFGDGRGFEGWVPKAGGADVVMRGHFTSVAVKRGGKWVYLVDHATDDPAPAASPSGAAGH